MITCKNDRLLELLWFVGYCIEFPTQLAVRIGGGAEWIRRVMYRAIREGYQCRKECTQRRPAPTGVANPNGRAGRARTYTLGDIV